MREDDPGVSRCILALSISPTDHVVEPYFGLIATDTRVFSLRARQAAALNPSHKKWEDCVRQHLSPHYVMLRSHSLQAINLMIFVHRALVPDIHGIQSAVVATGVSLGGTTQMGNKGAVGISFNCHQHSFLFLSCHFAANQDMVEKRNADYHTIENCMALFPTESVSRSNSARSDAVSPEAWDEKPNVRVIGCTIHSVHALVAAAVNENDARTILP